MILHRTARNSRTRFLAAPLLAVLFAAACGGPGDAPAESAGPVTTLSSGAPVETTGADVVGGVSAEADGDELAAPSDVVVQSGSSDVSEDGETPEPAEPAGDGATGDCLVGSWKISAANLDAYYDELEEAGVAFDLSGNVLLALNADGTFVYTPTFGFEMTIDGMTASGHSSGQASGVYTAENGQLTLTGTEDGTDFTMSMMGMTMSASDLGVGLVGFSDLATPYGCQDGLPYMEYLTPNGTHRMQYEQA